MHRFRQRALRNYGGRTERFTTPSCCVPWGTTLRSTSTAIPPSPSSSSSSTTSKRISETGQLWKAAVQEVQALCNPANPNHQNRGKDILEVDSTVPFVEPDPMEAIAVFQEAFEIRGSVVVAGAACAPDLSSALTNSTDGGVNVEPRAAEGNKKDGGDDKTTTYDDSPSVWRFQLTALCAIMRSALVAHRDKEKTLSPPGASASPDREEEDGSQRLSLVQASSDLFEEVFPQLTTPTEGRSQISFTSSPVLLLQKKKLEEALHLRILTAVLLGDLNTAQKLCHWMYAQRDDTSNTPLLRPRSLGLVLKACSQQVTQCMRVPTSTLDGEQTNASSGRAGQTREPNLIGLWTSTLELYELRGFLPSTLPAQKSPHESPEGVKGDATSLVPLTQDDYACVIDVLHGLIRNTIDTKEESCNTAFGAPTVGSYKSRRLFKKMALRFLETILEEMMILNTTPAASSQQHQQNNRGEDIGNTCSDGPGGGPKKKKIQPKTSDAPSTAVSFATMEGVILPFLDTVSELGGRILCHPMKRTSSDGEGSDHCSICKGPLSARPLNGDEREVFLQALESQLITTSRSNTKNHQQVFQQQKRNFENFKKLLASGYFTVGPEYSKGILFIDGANVGYVGAGKKNKEAQKSTGLTSYHVYYCIHRACQEALKTGFKPLVILPAAFTKQHKMENPAKSVALLQNWMKERLVFQVPQGLSDDFVWMYGCMYLTDTTTAPPAASAVGLRARTLLPPGGAGKGVVDISKEISTNTGKVRAWFLSNDQLRDHVKQPPFNSLAFRRWQKQHRVRFIRGDSSSSIPVMEQVKKIASQEARQELLASFSFLFQSPNPYEESIQRSKIEPHWHVPVSGKTGKSTCEWYCLRL